MMNCNNSDTPKHCPKCRTECIVLPKSSNICLAEAPESITKNSKNAFDLKLSMWAYLEPPKVSGITHMIDSEHVDKVRKLLNNSKCNEKGILKHFDSKILITYKSDGSAIKKKTKTQIYTYPKNDLGPDDESFNRQCAMRDEDCDDTT